MSDQQQYDTEITLGVGKLTGLFFLLVILCGIFLGLGYTLGRNSAKQEGLLANEAVPAGSISNAAKPGASQAQPASKPASDASTDSSAKTDNADADTGKPESSAQTDTKAPELKSLPAGGFVVQVAAVSKKEDADALQQALQHKQYPVVVTSATDKLFHVQIGPFADLKDAESMKARLAADGYNAIVKR